MHDRQVKSLTAKDAKEKQKRSKHIKKLDIAVSAVDLAQEHYRNNF